MVPGSFNDPREIEILRQALGRLRGLSRLYQSQISIATSQRIREVLIALAAEKAEHANRLEKGILRLGDDAVGIPIPLEHFIAAQRELIPSIYQEEQAFSLWCREQISVARDSRIRQLLEGLMIDEERHLIAIKDLYRSLTHC